MQLFFKLRVVGCWLNSSNLRSKADGWTLPSRGENITTLIRSLSKRIQWCYKSEAEDPDLLSGGWHMSASAVLQKLLTTAFLLWYFSPTVSVSTECHHVEHRKKSNYWHGKKYFPRRTFLREAKTSVFDCHISRKRVESYQTFYFRFLNKKITCIFSLVEFLLLFLCFVVLHFFPSSPGISNFSLAKDVVLQQTPVWPKGVFFLVKLILGLWPHSPFLCRAPVFFMHSISTHLTHSMLS